MTSINKQRTRIAVFWALMFGRRYISAFTYSPESRNQRQLSILAAAPEPSSSKQTMMFPSSVYETILQGQIAVIPNFIPPNLVKSLRDDAINLQRDGHFTADALAAYGKQENFDPAKDRTVLKLAQWKRTDLGNADLRHNTFGSLIARLRTDLAQNLDRPKLDRGLSTTAYGIGSTEISYTRFGPGAYLKRHVDEHHEELKGRRGWEKPTRRSVSWLVYLNEPDWEPRVHGGFIRCFQRRAKPSYHVGAMNNGDLQIGWLRPSEDDPTRPVFLDGRRGGADGHCAMYVVENETAKNYITKNFQPDPLLYVSGSEMLTRRLLIDSPPLASRFHFIEPPKSAASELLSKSVAPSFPFNDEEALDIAPIGGTLVVFDSVSLPHEVLPAWKRERWATSGWFHEDQQEEHTLRG